MRYYRPKIKFRPPSRLDSSRPVREAVPVAERDLKRLAAAIEATRERLGVTQEGFAALAELSLPTIQRVEAGKVAPRAKTYHGLDLGAGWPPGTARAIAEGTLSGPPEPAQVTAGSAARRRLTEMSDLELALRIAEVVEVEGGEAAGKLLARIWAIRAETRQPT